MGKWLKANGETIYGTVAGDVPQQEWGCTTRKGDKLYVHIFEFEGDELRLPLTQTVVNAKLFGKSKKVAYSVEDGEVVLSVGNVKGNPDYIIELTTVDPDSKKGSKKAKKAKAKKDADEEEAKESKSKSKSKSQSEPDDVDDEE
jgi:hypothetical protein